MWRSASLVCVAVGLASGAGRECVALREAGAVEVVAGPCRSM